MSYHIHKKNNRIVSFLFSSSVFLTANLSFANSLISESTLLIAQSSNGDKLFITSIQPEGNFIEVEVKANLKTPEVINKISYEIVSYKYIINCKSRSYKINSKKYYSEIKNIDPVEIVFDANEFKDIYTDSGKIDKLIYNAVCEKNTSKESTNDNKQVPTELQAPATSPISENIAISKPQPEYSAPQENGREIPTSPRVNPTPYTPPNSTQPEVQIEPETAARTPDDTEYPSSGYQLIEKSPFSDFDYRTASELVYFSLTDLIENDSKKEHLSSYVEYLKNTRREGWEIPTLIVMEASLKNLEQKSKRLYEGLVRKEQFFTFTRLEYISSDELKNKLKLHESALVADVYRKNNHLLVAFRGTVSASDWLTNLWLGIDFEKIDAPRYQQAQVFIEKLIKSYKGHTVVLTGHSLGGGIAQFISAKYQFPAVVFNPSLLPERYLNGIRTSKATVKIFSSVEENRNNPNYPFLASDPVSLGISSVIKYTDKLFPDAPPIKARYLASKPICVISKPSPFIDQWEEADARQQINKALHSGIVSNAGLGFSKSFIYDKAALKSIYLRIGQITADIDRSTVQLSLNDKDLYKKIQKDIEIEAANSYDTIGGSISLLKDIGVGIFSSSPTGLFKSTGALLGRVGKLAAYDQLTKRVLYPHSMSRFNRGVSSRDMEFADKSINVVGCALDSNIRIVNR